MLAQLQQLQAVLAASEAVVPAITASGDAIAAALHGGGKVLTCGNGGSAADALHLSEELTGRYRSDRPPLPAICLAADGCALTCIGNDYGFAELFARQVAAFAQAGDVLIAFSTSGNSPNVVRAIEEAKARGATTVLLTGHSGGKCRSLADHAVCVPSTVTARIQEVHGFVLHQWLDIIEARLFGVCASQ